MYDGESLSASVDMRNQSHALRIESPELSSFNQRLWVNIIHTSTKDGKKGTVWLVSVYTKDVADEEWSISQYEERVKHPLRCSYVRAWW